MGFEPSKMIIIDGIDCSGKSTLAKYLSKELNFEYRKSDKRDGLKGYIEDSLTARENVVSDRFYMCEYVYPLVKKDGRVPLPLWGQHMVERQLMMSNSVIVHCYSDEVYIKEKFDSRGEDYIGKKDVKKTLDLFKQVVDRSLLPVIKFDPKVDSYKYILGQIKVILANKKWKQFEKFRSIGDIHCNPIMLVGDKLSTNESIDETVNKPFYTTNGCTPYLHEALAYNSDVNSYYITNSEKYIGKVKINILLLHNEVSLLSPRKIIALGNNASSILTKGKIKHEKVVHPKFMKKFFYKKVKQYSKILR